MILDPSTTKIAFNAKSQLKMLLSKGIELVDGLWDPKIAAWVLNSETNKVHVWLFFFDFWKDKGLDQLYAEYTKDKTNIQPGMASQQSFLRVHRYDVHHPSNALVTCSE